MRFSRSALGLLIAITIAVSSSSCRKTSAAKPSPLTCASAKFIMSRFLVFHLTYRDINDEIKQRTIKSLFTDLDPQKLYFLKEDFNSYMRNRDKVFNGLSTGNCVEIMAIMDLYKKRFTERFQVIENKLKADFKVNKEYKIISDPKDKNFPATQAEADLEMEKFGTLQLINLFAIEKKMDKAKKKLIERYDRLNKRITEYNQEKFLDIFVNAFSRSLDPHSNYLSKDELDDFNISSSLSLEGIGAVLQSIDGYTVIKSLIPGGGAQKSGKLKPGDKIIAVAQEKQEYVDVFDMDLRDVVKLIRGAQGTNVKLSIFRESATKNDEKHFEVLIARKKINIESSAAKSEIVKTKGNRKVGIIKLPGFYLDFQGKENQSENYKSSSVDVYSILSSLKNNNVDAVLLDLRNNGGGSLVEAVNIAGFFIEGGNVVSTKDYMGKIVPLRDKANEIIYNGPLGILTNKFSASASEIVAGALQDYKRSLTMGGSHTFGKGTVQTLMPISDELGAIKVTVGRYYTAGGSSTQNKGVVPDINLPGPTDFINHSEKTLEYSTSWDKITPMFVGSSSTVPAKTPWKKVETSYFTKLQKASTERIEKDTKYKELLDKIEKSKKEADKKYISIKEQYDEVIKNLNSNNNNNNNLLSKEEPDEEENKIDLTEPQIKESLNIMDDYIQLISKGKK